MNSINFFKKKNISIKTLYPNLKIKFPWKFSLGDNSMIGSATWIDNVDVVEIKENVCISQGTYICSGNHNYKSLYFEYKPGKIIINYQKIIYIQITSGKKLLKMEKF